MELGLGDDTRLEREAEAARIARERKALQTGETVVDVILAACARRGDGIAFSCLDGRLSYRELERLSARFAAFLQGRGLRPGDRIALQLPNILHFPVAALGALRAGLVLVNTNPLYSPLELEHQLRDAGARALVVFANTAEAAVEAVPRSGVELVVVAEIGDLHPALRRLALNLGARYVKKLVPKLRFSQAIGFRQALREGRHGRLVEEPPRAAEALAVLQYTGGTTGTAKGAMLSHRNLVANMYQFKGRLEGDCPEPGEVMVAPLPLYHIYAFTIHMLYALHQGVHNLLIPNPRDIPALVATLKRHRIAGFIGINTLYNALCGSSEFARLDFSHLKIASAGGMALSTKTFQRWQELTGCRIFEGYGLTEASPLVACNSSSALQAGTIGVPVPGTELRIVDEQGRDVVEGEAGELWIRGPQVMAGYWQRPEETREVLDAEGWLRSGDVALRQPDGFLRIVDRIKDLIIVSGFNVFPAEIEDYVCKHPDVREAAAVGIRRGDIGERVKLFVVSNNPALTREDLIEYCRHGLAPYKVPRLIEFRDSLPKSNVGKVLRRELKKSSA